MQLKHRVLALPLAAVMASGAFFASTPAQAAPKSKTYKAGAIALGALGAYFLSKGKTVEGAAALGGGYLAYKQGEKERKNEKYDRYGRNDDRYDNGGYYNGNDGRNKGHYNNSGYSNGNGGSYGNGGYYGSGGAYNGNTYYNSNADYRYNNSGSNWNNDRNGDRQCRDKNGSRGNDRSWNR